MLELIGAIVIAVIFVWLLPVLLVATFTVPMAIAAHIRERFKISHDKTVLTVLAFVVDNVWWFRHYPRTIQSFRPPGQPFKKRDGETMRKSLWLVLACLALPLAASADSIGITTDGGTISATVATLSLSGDVMTMYGAISGSNLGTVLFTTGAFESGSVAAGGTLGAGGTFTVTGNGSAGVPTGVIFTGTFDSGTWTFDTSTSSYTFNGDVTGSGGTATIKELTLSGTLNPNGSIAVGSGAIVLSTPVTTAPEPASLLLLGTGLLGVGLVFVLRKRNSRGHQLAT